MMETRALLRNIFKNSQHHKITQISIPLIILSLFPEMIDHFWRNQELIQDTMTNPTKKEEQRRMLFIIETQKVLPRNHQNPETKIVSPSEADLNIESIPIFILFYLSTLINSYLSLKILNKCIHTSITNFLHF